LDIATVVGLIAAITCLLLGIGPDLSAVIDVPALVIVVGGTIATALIANPLQDVMSLFGIYWKTVSVRVPDLQKLVERIVAFAENARREGMRVVGERIALVPSSDPPPIVEHKLAVYLPPWDRPTGCGG